VRPGARRPAESCASPTGSRCNTSRKRVRSAKRSTSSTGRTTSLATARVAPIGPLAIFVHLASVWVPFTSEAKEAVAHYPELLREITLALQECAAGLLSTCARAPRRERDQNEGAFSSATSRARAEPRQDHRADRTSIENIFHKALPSFVNIHRSNPKRRSRTAAPTARRPPRAQLPRTSRSIASPEGTDRRNRATARARRRTAVPRTGGQGEEGAETARKGEQLKLLE